MQISTRWLWAAGAACLVSLSVTPQVAAQDISIGAVIPLSGPSATSGEDQRRGIELALEEVNAGGGVLGKPLKVIVEDSGGRAPSALDAVKKLVTVNDVPVVLGEFSSGVTLPIGQYLVQEKRVHLNIASTSGRLRELGEGSFSLVGLDHVSTAFAAEDAIKAGWKKVALIAPNNAYGQGVIEQFTKHYTAKGGTIAASIAYPEGQTTYRRELQQLERSQPDAYIYTAYGKEGAVINRETFELGMNEKPWYGILLSMCVGDTDPKFKANQVGMDVNYIGPNGRSYEEKYKAKYKGPFLTTWNAYAYDGVKLAAAAINKAGSTEPAKVAAAVSVLGKDFEGASGQLALDEHRHRSTQPYLRLKVQDGALVPR